MKLHVQKLLAAALVLALLCLSAACGKGTNDPEPAESTTAETSTEEIAPVAAAEETLAETTGSISAETTEQETSTQAESTTEEQTEEQTEAQTEEQSTAPKTKAQVIAYLNDALNAVKANRPGFTKAYKRDASGDITGLPGWLSNIIRQNETKTYQKGTDYTDIFPAAGYSWSSRLRESDVTKFSIEENGKYYDIRVDLGNETNPTPGETSSYGRCMSVVTVSSAESIPGIKNVSMQYHNGYVTARVDAETNRIVRCAFSAAADVQASVAVLGDISVSDIVSTETFTDFVW